MLFRSPLLLGQATFAGEASECRHFMLSRESLKPPGERVVRRRSVGAWATDPLSDLGHHLESLLLVDLGVDLGDGRGTVSEDHPGDVQTELFA